jgi:hypothetical protein
VKDHAIVRKYTHKIVTKIKGIGIAITQLGYSRPLKDVQLLGFSVGGADHLSPQTHSLCLWSQQKAANKTKQSIRNRIGKMKSRGC